MQSPKEEGFNKKKHENRLSRLGWGSHPDVRMSSSCFIDLFSIIFETIS